MFFLVFYLYRRRKKFLLSFIVILIGIPHLNAFLPVRIGRIFNKTEFSESKNKLKILSFNVRAFNAYKWYSDSRTSRSIINLIRSENPDIICLQEYLTNPRSDNKTDNILNLFSKTPYYFIHNSLPNRINSGNGIATFSRFPIINKGSMSFRNTSNEAIFTDVLFSGDTIRIYNNHLQSVRFHERNYAFLDTLRLNYDEEDIREIVDISMKLKTAYLKRAEQVDTISLHIQNSPYPVIVCGDFNDTPISYTYHKMSKGLRDAFISSGRGSGNTYHGIFPSYRIDYILHSKDFYSLLFEKVKVELSDHYPIICILDLKNIPVPVKN